MSCEQQPEPLVWEIPADRVLFGWDYGPMRTAFYRWLDYTNIDLDVVVRLECDLVGEDGTVLATMVPIQDWSVPRAFRAEDNLRVTVLALLLVLIANKPEIAARAGLSPLSDLVKGLRRYERNRDPRRLACDSLYGSVQRWAFYLESVHAERTRWLMDQIFNRAFTFHTHTKRVLNRYLYVWLKRWDQRATRLYRQQLAHDAASMRSPIPYSVPEEQVTLPQIHRRELSTAQAQQIAEQLESAIASQLAHLPSLVQDLLALRLVGRNRLRRKRGTPFFLRDGQAQLVSKLTDAAATGYPFGILYPGERFVSLCFRPNGVLTVSVSLRATQTTVYWHSKIQLHTPSLCMDLVHLLPVGQGEPRGDYQVWVLIPPRGRWPDRFTGRQLVRALYGNPPPAHRALFLNPNADPAIDLGGGWRWKPLPGDRYLLASAQRHIHGFPPISELPDRVVGAVSQLLQVLPGLRLSAPGAITLTLDDLEHALYLYLLRHDSLDVAYMVAQLERRVAIHAERILDLLLLLPILPAGETYLRYTDEAELAEHAYLRMFEQAGYRLDTGRLRWARTIYRGLVQRWDSAQEQGERPFGSREVYELARGIPILEEVTIPVE